MSKELYKARRVDNGEWVIGNYIHQYHSSKKGRRINAIFTSNDIKSSRYEIVDETLEQISGKAIEEIHERNDTELSLTESYIKLQELFMESMYLLSDVWYWETCPKDYKERIVKLQITEEAKINK